MSTNKERASQTIKFLKWTRENDARWRLICEPDNEKMNYSVMKLLIEQLTKERFYEIILVLLHVHKDKEYTKKIYQDLFANLLTKVFEDGKEDDIINNFSDHLN